jgi:hypothetical protein
VNGGAVPECRAANIFIFSGNQPVKRIQPREIRGKIVYDVELDIPRAVNRHVRIAETGEVLADTRPSSNRGRPTSPPRP